MVILTFGESQQEHDARVENLKIGFAWKGRVVKSRKTLACK